MHPVVPQLMVRVLPITINPALTTLTLSLNCKSLDITDLLLRLPSFLGPPLSENDLRQMLLFGIAVQNYYAS